MHERKLKSFYYKLLNLLFTFSGGKLVYLYTKKQGTTPKCGDCKEKLRGVSVLPFFTFKI